MKYGRKKVALTVVVLMFTGMLGFVNIQAAPTTPAPFKKGVVVASLLNVRQGPGTNYKIVCTLKRGDTTIVHSRMGNWLVVSCPDGHVGCALAQYIKKFGTALPPVVTSKPKPKPPSSTPKPSTGSTTGATLTADERSLIDQINAQRANNGLAALKVDAKLMTVGRLKAKDMVVNNYFSHQSPTYGSPFDMMKNYGVTYIMAGENIAGNGSLSGAVTAWMNSPGHRANILKSNFNYTGVGIYPSSVYGKILVQEFIQK